MILWCLRKQQRQIFRSRERISIRFFCQSFELRNLSASLLRSLFSYLSIRCLLISARTGHISSNLCSLPQVGQLFSISLHLFHISTKAALADGSVQKEKITLQAVVNCRGRIRTASLLVMSQTSCLLLYSAIDMT